MKKGKFSKVLVPFIIISNILFTLVILYIFYFTGREPSTLIISWFGFTTGELGMLAGIKARKVKKEIAKVEKEGRDYSERI
jgi:hypothetical protein